MTTNSKKIGSKRLVVGAHYGLKDWLVQRVTAIILAVYTLGIVAVVLIPGELTYARWAAPFTFSLFNFPVGKILAVLALLSLCYHAWIGVRDIWMDYIKPTWLRLSLQVLTLLWLLGSVTYGLQILWRL